MSNQSIVIDGEGVTVTFDSNLISDINTVAFSVAGAKETIDLTTINNTRYKTKLLSTLEEIEDVVVNKKFDPAADLAMSNANALLVITYKIGRSTTKTLTYWADRQNNASATLERSPSDGINHDVTFVITNLNASLEETGPAIAS